MASALFPESSLLLKSLVVRPVVRAEDHDRLGPAIRLDQERIGFAWVRDVLARLEPER